MLILTEDSEHKTKGNFITCKICSKKWKFGHLEDRVEWKDTKYVCPFCGISYCILPENERELRCLQDVYLENGKKQRDLTKLFYELVKYAESLIKKKYGGHPVVKTQDINIFARDAVSLLMEKYSNPDFKIKISFGGFLIHKIRESLFAKKTHTCADETINYKFDDGNFTNYEDTKPQEQEKLVENDYITSLCINLPELIFALESKCSSKAENKIRLLAVKTFLDYGDKGFSKFFKHFPRQTGKFMAQKTIDIIRMELLELYGEKQLKFIKESLDNESLTNK